MNHAINAIAHENKIRRWQTFTPPQNTAPAALCGLFSLRRVYVSRLGLRYINATTSELHGIAAISDLNLRVMVADDQIGASVNVNYMNEHEKNTQSVVRIATPDFVIGSVPAGATLMIDVDVFTKAGYKATAAEDVRGWAEFAHEEEKKQFFRLLRPETKEALRED